MLRLNRLADDWSPIGNVVKADEHQAMLTAEALIAEAKQRAEKIVRDAEQEYQRQQVAGYETGLAKANQEAAEKMVATTAEQQLHLRSLEAQLAELVAMSVQKIIGQVNARDRVVGLVRSGLSELIGQTKIRVEVHPQDVAHLQARLEEIRNGQPGLEILEVLGDPQAEPNSCVLRTDWNVIDAGLSTQLESLRRALEVEP